MIEWQGAGTVLAARPHGETAAILEAFTAAQGRLAGIVHGGASRKNAAALQPGSELALRWRARSEDALGSFALEPLRSRAHILSDRRALAGLAAVTALLSYALPERQPYPRLHAGTETLLDGLGTVGWEAAYLEWEVLLLAETGFALDLSRCAVTGMREGLEYVSPRTGRAISAVGAGEWRDRLLPLPPALKGEEAGLAGVVEGLRVTGHFLEQSLARSVGRDLPEARQRLVDRLAREAG